MSDIAVSADLPIELTSTSWPRRLWHRLASLFSAEVRASTPEEIRLRSEVERLRAALEDRQEQVRLLRHDLEEYNSKERIYALEIGRLTDVIERDRLRVEAEKAAYAAQAALVTGVTGRGGAE